MGDRTSHRQAQYEEHRTLLVRAGVPREEIERMRKMYEGVRQYADSFEANEYNELRDEEELEFETGTLRIVHTPGHTPGSCSFVREADRTVIAGDCVLKRITPNPILSPDPIDPSKRFASLAEYLVSLARLRTFAPTLVHGGHGEPVHDFEELFNRYFRAIRERQAEVIRLLPKPAPAPGRSRVRCFRAPTTCTSFSPFQRPSRILTWRIRKGRSRWNSVTGKKSTDE